jgi:hypothetical protein
MTALGRRELALSTVGTVVRQHFDFGKMENEVPGMTFGAAVRCMVTIQESGILSLVLSCKRLREDGKVVERVVGALKVRIMGTLHAPAHFVGRRIIEGEPLLVQAKQVLLFLEARDPSGLTKLARCNINPEEFRLIPQLLQYGAEVNESDNNGHTPLMMAVSWNRVGVARTLLDAKANPEMQAIRGWTALMLAASYNRVEMVELLLERQADINAKNSERKSALELTTDSDIKARLIKAGARPKLNKS